jgi:hypothetical protein
MTIKYVEAMMERREAPEDFEVNLRANLGEKFEERIRMDLEVANAELSDEIITEMAGALVDIADDSIETNDPPLPAELFTPLATIESVEAQLSRFVLPCELVAIVRLDELQKLIAENERLTAELDVTKELV